MRKLILLPLILLVGCSTPIASQEQPSLITDGNIALVTQCDKPIIEKNPETQEKITRIEKGEVFYQRGTTNMTRFNDGETPSVQGKTKILNSGHVLIGVSSEPDSEIMGYVDASFFENCKQVNLYP
ncbi:MAG TPA: hypothetical protein V6C65_04575 [Allocoleopsis sp.]